MKANAGAYRLPGRHATCSLVSDRWQVETDWDGGEAYPVWAALPRINTMKHMSALTLAVSICGALP